MWPDLRGQKAQARRLKERKDDKVKAHRVEHSMYRFWDRWLSDGRVPHLFASDQRGRCRDLFEGTPYELERAEPDQRCFDLSPDGRFVAFGYDPGEEKQVDAEYDIVELDLQRRRFRNLTPGKPHRHYHHPRYAPDGATLACLSNDVRKSPLAPSEITLIERRRGAITMVSRRWDRSVEAPLAWSSDGAAALARLWIIRLSRSS